MSPNSDNAMARFLFAILKQKNLKDIDWNQVAQDPVLMSPITNGHAARMRFSRFRSTILNNEPQKRGRVGDKGRVTKSTKKDTQSRKSSIVKSESSASLSSYAQLSPASMTSPYMGELQDDFATRFLTPCSDDMASGLCMNPASIRTSSGRHSDSSLFSTTIDGCPDFMAQVGHDQTGLGHSPAYSASAFEAAFDMTSYKVGSVECPQPNEALMMNEHQSLADFTHEWSDRMHLPHRG
ncbi:hypothetical protein HJFPF1_06478 [Paramyrothecium foliicola]|nr:hypothetical protein HJFPF1_06478 [Paramyrothecium foliicola]